MNDRLKLREWGNGIPKYTEEDLMTKEEIHSFGVEIVAGQLKREGYKIINFNRVLGLYPSIIAENNNEVVAVVVKTDIAPNKPELNVEDKLGIVGFCDGYSTKPCFASVSIGAADPVRFGKSLALVGDGYHVIYKGLEYISK